MGINSTEVSYGFGQLGSAYQNENDAPIYPPKGMVIVAIQFLSSNKLSVLETEVLGSGGSQYITTTAVETEDNNYLGVTEAIVNSATNTTVNFTNDTVVVTDVASNAKIKPGQYVLLTNASTINTELSVDTTANEAVTPIYNGRNKQGAKVVSVAGGTYGTHVTLDTVLTPTTSPQQYLIFLDESHGAGSTSVTDAIFPTGVVIYGRWTKAALANQDLAGGAVFYFGK
jgi:hypothetical protein